MIAFGPIPSRRLGKSLGINNIPPKICSYSCIYCQAGKATKMTSTREEFYSPNEIFEKVKLKVKQAFTKGEHIDYLSFVPDGEPTLDKNLGKEIELLKSLGIKIAVFTNGSLLIDPIVRFELSKADLVSVKMDANDIHIWKQINHPYRSINLNSIIEGISMFRQTFRGRLITETMLVKDVNDSPDHINGLAELISNIEPKIAYLAIPTRPPLIKTVKPPNEEIINNCYQIFNGKINHVEYLTGYEGNEFAYTGNVEKDILSITSVHPLRKDAINEIIKKANENWNLIETLILQEKLVETEYQNNKYYVRKL